MPGQKPLFTFEDSGADKTKPPEDYLRREFQRRGIILASNSALSAAGRAGAWSVTDAAKTTYLIEKVQGKVNVYVQRRPDGPVV